MASSGDQLRWRVGRDLFNEVRKDREVGPFGIAKHRRPVGLQQIEILDDLGLLFAIETQQTEAGLLSTAVFVAARALRVDGLRHVNRAGLLILPHVGQLVNQSRVVNSRPSR
jgi:hypothetical protein